MDKLKNTNRSLIYNILFAIIAYISVWVLINLLGTLALFAERQMSFGDCIKKIVFGSIEYNSDSTYTLIIFSIIHFANMIATVILTSYIFIFVFNKKPKTVIPNKMIIRRRSSGELCLGIIIGNRTRYLLENVTCTIRFLYIKTDTGGGLNAEYTKSSTIPDIKNYYRFSFPVNELPRQFLRNHILKDQKSFISDAITVMITGTSRYIGSSFSITKIYRHADIEIYDKEVTYTDPQSKKVFWNRILNNPSDCSEIARMEIVEELKSICGIGASPITSE